MCSSDLYTDTDSKIQLYRRIRNMFLWVVCVNSVCCLNLVLQAVHFNTLLTRCSAAAAALMLLAILRGARKCTRKIQELERLTQ